jgi:3-hydroxybutyrate dehydrogenase
VTGSTSGIGLGIAEALAASGMSVMLNGRGDAGEIEATRARIESATGVRVRYSPADMTRPGETTGMIEQAHAELGRIDVLVNNAGILHIVAIEETPPDIWATMLAINLDAAFHAMRAALPAMKSRRSGRIINISSALGIAGAANYSAYCASKHALVGLTKCAALEAATYGITVNAICPGYVLTPLVERELAAVASTSGITPEAARQAALATGQPTRRFIQTSEIGALATFLASEHAASITGAALSIDGAWTAH